MPTTFKPSTFIALALACGALSSPVWAADGVAKRGAQLVAYGGCGDCHTPFKMGPQGPEKDLARGLSGHPQNLTLPPPPSLDGPWNWAGAATNTAFAGPWGVTYASNLTPDRETGIGQWQEKDFVQAMRTGTHVGGQRPILPPMPWAAVASLSDQDLKAIFAYLKTLPAVKNRVPEYTPPTALTGQAGGAKPGA